MYPMIRNAIAVLPALPLAFAAACAVSQEDENAVDTDFTKTTCAQMAALSEQDRAFSLIFYYGYMAGRSAATTIDNGAVNEHLAAVRDYCNAHPESSVVDAFVGALKK